MSKKRNKKYHPKPVNPLAFEQTVRLVKPVEEESKIKLSLDNHAAIEAFARGAADKAHFDCLASTVDVTLLMLNNLFEGADDLKAEVKEGWAGMVRARDRYKETEKLGLDGQAYSAMKRVCDIYDEVVNNVTGAELVGFYRARDFAIKNGNYYKGNAADLEKLAA